MASIIIKIDIMGNACAKKPKQSNPGQPVVVQTNQPNQAAVPVGVQRIGENVYRGNTATMVVPTQLQPMNQEGPATTMTNTMMMGTGTGVVPINNYVSDPYLNSSYVRATNYAAVQGYRTTNAIYPANGVAPTVVQGTGHAVVTTVPHNGPATTHTYDYDIPPAPIARRKGSHEFTS